MKISRPWAAAGALLLVAGLSFTTWSARQKATGAAAPAAPVAVVELAASDISHATTRPLLQGLPVAGTLRAVNSAYVKARVAGELQGLQVREGDPVSAGQVLARIDSTEYSARWQQARQQADAAKAQREIAQRQFDNNQALVNQGFISKTALDTSAASLQGADATYRAALAAADVARKSVDDTVVKAPISGQVAQRLAQNGERLGIDARIVEIVDLRQLELEATLGAAESLSLRPGQLAELRVEGHATPFEARLARINPSTQAGSRSVLAYLSIHNAATPVTLRQGLFAQGTLGTTRVVTLSVPLSAVRTDKPTPYVQVVEDARVRHQPVVPGLRGQVDKETVVAVTGLAENAVVIRGAAGLLREGSLVRFTGLAIVDAAALKTPDAAQRASAPAP